MNGDRSSTFLLGPNEIVRAIDDLAKQSDVMKLAVAFIRSRWRSVFENFAGAVKVICWLSSSSTDPYAVDEMRKDHRFDVRQVDSMHAKVYLAPGVGAVVGSANLSGTALNDSDSAGQYEAAILVRDLRIIQGITGWFDDLWRSATEITASDLARAKVAFDRNKAAQSASASLTQLGHDPKTTTVKAITHLTSMPVSPRTGSPLYSRGAVRDVFELLAMRAGGANAAEIRAAATKHVALYPVTRHCREDGRQGWCWDLFIDGKRQAVDPTTGFSRAAFDALPGSARIQLSNFRHAKRHADSHGWSSM